MPAYSCGNLERHMHDIKEIRDNPEQFDAHLKRRGLPSCSAQILDLDKKLRAVIEKLQSLQQERNQVAAQMAQAKKSGEDAAPFIERGSRIKKEIPALEDEERGIRDRILSILAELPNVLSSDTPDGASEADNVEILKKGACRDFPFIPREHFEVGERLGLMDFQAASDLSGSRFVVLKGDLAQLERALAQFMVDMHTSKMGYELVSPPLLVKDPAMYGTGQLPKFSEDAFQTTKGHWLIPTAEVPLTCLAANKIIDEKVLPLRYTAHTACFRSEAGSAGKDTRGMLRQHQFYKVELVSLATADQAEDEFKHMVSAACAILDALQLPYRVMQLCSGDVGFSAKKPTILKCGCRARKPTGKFPVVPTVVLFKRNA